MENKVLGLHHITAIATSAKETIFIPKCGLRFVKKTVNFDDQNLSSLLK
jgi:glyoxalase family protein